MKHWKDEAIKWFNLADKDFQMLKSDTKEFDSNKYINIMSYDTAAKIFEHIRKKESRSSNESGAAVSQVSGSSFILDDIHMFRTPRVS